VAVDTRQIIALFVFFFGLALCMWRAPKADRWHVVLRLIAVTLWCGLLVFEPRTRTVGYGFVVTTFVIAALSEPLQGRFSFRR
jgi:Na+/H+ antiporter NhaD/arsenite permease-like protein